MDRNSTSSNIERDQVQRSVNLECQDQPETSEARLRRIRSTNTRFPQLDSSDTPSTSNIDHPMAASERDQSWAPQGQQWKHNPHPEPPDSLTPQDQEYQHLEHEPGSWEEYLEQQRHNLDRQLQEQSDRHIEEQLDQAQREYEQMSYHQQYDDYHLQLQDSYEQHTNPIDASRHEWDQDLQQRGLDIHEQWCNYKEQNIKNCEESVNRDKQLLDRLKYKHTQLKQDFTNFNQDFIQRKQNLAQSEQIFTQKEQELAQLEQQLAQSEQILAQKEQLIAQQEQQLAQRRKKLEQWREWGEDVYQWHQDIQQPNLCKNRQEWIDRHRFFYQEWQDLQQQHESQQQEAFRQHHLQQQDIFQQCQDWYNLLQQQYIPEHDLRQQMNRLDTLQKHDNFENPPEDMKELLNKFRDEEQSQRVFQHQLNELNQKLENLHHQQYIERQEFLQQRPYLDLIQRQQLEKLELFQQQWSSEWQKLQDLWPEQDRRYIEQNSKLLRKLLQDPPQHPDDQLKLLNDFKEWIEVRRGQMKMRMCEYLGMDQISYLRKQQIDLFQQTNEHFQQLVNEFKQQNNEFQEEFANFYKQVRKFYKQYKYVEHAIKELVPERHQQILNHIEQFLDTERNELNLIEKHLHISLSKETSQTWSEFSHSTLEETIKDNKICNNYHLVADILRGRKADHVEKERDSQAYYQTEAWVRAKWEKDHARVLLDRDLSEVPTGTWLRFSHDLLVKHAQEYETDSPSYRYLKDILQGQTAKHVSSDEGCSTMLVSDDERKSQAYRDLILLARDKVDELLSAGLNLSWP